MKLSKYAQELGVSYKTVWRLWKAGKLNAFQLPTGTIIVYGLKQNKQIINNQKGDNIESKDSGIKNI